MGIGFTALLGLLFIGLKLCHQIDWSWWYVTMPLWLPLSIGLTLIVIGTVGEKLIWLCMSEEERNRHKLKESLEALANALKQPR